MIYSSKEQFRSNASHIGWVFALGLGIASGDSSFSQASEYLDIARVLIGRGYSSAEFSCEDGSRLTANYEVRPDYGPTVILASSGEKSISLSLSRYLQPADFEISQCTVGISVGTFRTESLEVMVCYRTPKDIESLRVRSKVGSFFEEVADCRVRNTTRSK